MGRYRSEMGLEAEDAKKAEREKETRQRMATEIKKAIKKEGIEFVLADIIRDPTMSSVRFNR